MSKDPKKDIRYPADLIILVYVTIALAKAISLSILWENGLIDAIHSGAISDFMASRSLKIQERGLKENRINDDLSANANQKAKGGT